MLEILLEPDGSGLDLRLPTHQAFRSVLQRSLQFEEPCRCEAPWLRLFLSEVWCLGKLDLSDIQACCEARRQEALRLLPWTRPLDTLGVTRDLLPLVRPDEAIRFLLTDLCGAGEEFSPDEAMIATLAPSRESFVRPDMILVRCEAGPAVFRTRIESLLVRAFFQGPPLEEALRRFERVEVVAFWRAFGFDWTPRSIRAAERFGIGVGGSFTANAIRLRG